MAYGGSCKLIYLTNLHVSGGRFCDYHGLPLLFDSMDVFFEKPRKATANAGGKRETTQMVLREK